MQRSLRRVLVASGCFLIIMVVAIAGYMLAGWSFLDSIYMVVITVFGVGFGETGPMTPPLRIFTIFVIVSGYTTVGLIVASLIQMITEGEIKKALGVRRMTREIKLLQDHVIICGFGRIGQILAKEMTTVGRPCIIIDSNPERSDMAAAMGYLVAAGTATDEEVLEAAGIMRAKVLATVLPSDSVNVFITLTARGLNPNLIILARGELPTTEKKLRQAGADHVVLPAEIGALRMSHMITHPAALDFLDGTHDGSNLNELLAQIDMQMDELAIAAESPLVGITIGDLEVRGKNQFLIVALRKEGGETIVHPHHAVILEEGDTLIVLGHQGDIPQIAHHYALHRQTGRYMGGVRS
jgi:voltage-gated potassium channel